MEHIKIFMEKIGDKFNTIISMIFVAIKFTIIGIGGLTILGVCIGSGIFALAFLFAIIYLYSAFVSAVVGSYLWLWFVVPVFGVSALTFPQAFGLSLLLNYWTYHHMSQRISDKRTLKEKLPETIGLVIRPWLILAIGWICYHYYIV